MQDRIYCSEQIKIPPSFPEILKQFSKSVLAEQPSDVVEFSIKYFGRLASESVSTKSVKYQPSIKQLQDQFKQCQDTGATAIIAFLKGKQVPEEVLQQLQSWYTFSMDQIQGEVDEKKLVFLLLVCLISNSLQDVLQNIFTVLQGPTIGYISKQDCVLIFKILSKVDFRVEKSMIDIVSEATQNSNEVNFETIAVMIGIKQK